MEKLEADPEDVDVLSFTPSDGRIVLGAIKGGIASIPYFGSIITGAWEGYSSGRFKDFVQELSRKISEIDESKIDRNFIESEEYYDLFLKGFRQRLQSRCKDKARFIVGLLTESFLNERSDRFSTSLKESFLSILDGFSDSEIKFLRDFSRGLYKDLSKSDIYEKYNNQTAIALDGLLSSGILREDDTWNKHIVESKRGLEFIDYMKLISWEEEL